MAMNFYIVFFYTLLLCDFAYGARKPKPNFRSGKWPVRRPNIIFILLDDMDTDLGSPNVMKKTQKILRQEGADFVNAFVTTPMCCPSRSSILTGKYAHNHYTFTNNLNCSSPTWRRGPEKKSYARYLEAGGYVTGHFGKYLNEYDGSWVPAGWKRWEGLIHNSRFYNYTIRHNTYKERHKMNYKEDYFTDLITNSSISFIRRTTAIRPDHPFLAVVSHAAPHGPETAAPQYSTAFPNATAPRLPNWNFISLDKQWILRKKQPMDAQKMAFVDLLHRRRLQTLLSVDDSVARIFSTLQSLGIENETYIFLTSDHGYHLGQFGLIKGKSMPFESDIRVPFYVRGPIIPKNIRMKEMVLNIDLAPTFLDIAGLPVPKDMDGSSVMKLFRKSRDGRRSKRRMHVVWRDTILIERSRGWRRTKSMLETSSRNKTEAGKERKAIKFIFEGKSRNKTQTNKERKLSLLEKICSKNKHQSPCQPEQLWECVTVDRRPRLRKCRKTGTVQATTTPTTRPTPSTAPTTPVKMCVCMKPRPENQGDMLPYYDELLEYEMDYFSAKELRRRPKRSRNSFNDRSRRSRNEFNARKYYKELARAQKLQNRRAKSKMLLRAPITGTKHPNASDTPTGLFDSTGVQELVEEKLGKLKEKISEIRMRLGALRDRRKKLLQMSASDRLIEYPCPCNPSNNTKPERATAASVLNGWEKDDDDDEEEQQIPPLRRRNKQPKAVSRKAEPKKKKISVRRSKCSSPGLNCFYQTNDHWKLPPLWTGGEFCFCPNAANNSYWCLRTINATHNFLYCEFITHFLEFFDLNQDPYQLYNVIDRVDPAVLSELHKQLDRMRACKGGNDCNHYHGKKYAEVNTTPKPLTTVPERSSVPLPTEGVSKKLGNRSKGVVNTPESAVTSSETTESSKVSPISTLAPTEAATVKTEVVTPESRSEGFGSRSDGTESTAETTLVSSEAIKSSPNVFPFTLTPVKTTEPSSSSPLISEGLGNPSQGIVSTPKITDDSSETTQTTPKVFPFTTLAPTEERVKTERLTTKPTVRKASKRRKGQTSVEKEGREEDANGEKEKPKSLKKSKKSKKKSSKNSKSLPLPIKSMVLDKATKMPRNISDQDKPEKEKKIHVNVEKPTESAITLTAGSDDVPTVLVNTSEREQSSSYTRISTILPTSLATLSKEENTSEAKYSTIKPTRRKSAKRRKNGEKEGKETLKKSKKLRKTKKKSGKDVFLKNSNTSSSGDNEEVSENQTRIETKSENERPESEENGNSEEGNKPLTETSKKRHKKPSGKRLNRNTKKRPKKPKKRPRPSQISGGGVAEGGDGDVSPSDP